MKLPSPENLALAQGENRYYRLGEWIADHAPDALDAAQDPLYMTLGLVGMAGLVGGVVTARAAAPALYYKAARGLAESEAAITWGYREARSLDHLTKLPIAGLWSDRTAGVQLIAPTGGGKTQALLPIIIADLEAGRDALIIEVSGDVGTEAERHARARGVEVLKVDASDESALAFNPIYAGTEQEAGQRAAAVMKAVATDHPHYSSMNQNLARYFAILARDYKRHHGRDPNEATLYDVRKFVLNHDHLRAAVGAYEGEDKQTYIDAEWLSPEAGEWLEQFYLRWRADYRDNTTSGFIAYLNNLLATEAGRECLCPAPDKEVVDLHREVSDGAGEPPTPGESGRLIVLRFPEDALEGDSATESAYWALKTIIETTRSGRSKESTPLSVFCDELPTLVGDASTAALKDFQLWITNIRKYNVAVHVAYQGWALLPDILNGTLQSNGRNILISGGMSGTDARRAQQMLGSDLEEDVAESSEVGRADHRRRRQVSIKEKPRYSVGEIQRIPRGQWWLLRFHRGRYRDPMVIRVPMARMPARGGPTHEELEEGGGAGEEQTQEAYQPSHEAAALLGRPGRSRAEEGSPAGEDQARYHLPGSTNALCPDSGGEDDEEGYRRAPGPTAAARRGGG